MLRLSAALLLLLPACTYHNADEAALAALSNRLTTLEQRQDALDARVTAQGDVLLRRTR
jgi:hypothetical protein